MMLSMLESLIMSLGVSLRFCTDIFYRLRGRIFNKSRTVAIIHWDASQQLVEIVDFKRNQYNPVFGNDRWGNSERVDEELILVDKPTQVLTRISSRLDHTARRREGGGMDRQGGKPRTDTRAQTDKWTCLNGSKPLLQVNAKCDVVMKLCFWHPDRYTHKAKPIHPRYAGCNHPSASSLAGAIYTVFEITHCICCTEMNHTKHD